MTTVQERLQIKREPLDKWSTREQLCLASAVAKSGDQNWMSVSRALKPFGDQNRPPDWFHQKNCAAQYGSLLEHVETPKRKKRTSTTATTTNESIFETPIETILRKLTQERLLELDHVLAEEKDEFLRLQDEMDQLHAGTVTDDQLDAWLKQINDQEQQKELEALAHAQWLKEREQRKQEIERAWRPVVKTPTATPTHAHSISLSLKRKSDTAEPVHAMDEDEATPPDPPKPALSPLLTSLLKSPSQASAPASTQSSILHSAITNQRAHTSNPTIASLLNSSPTVTVSPGLQQLVSTAIAKEPPLADLLHDTIIDSLPHIKVEDLESSMLSADEPLPEMRNEEVAGIISDLIQNAGIVSNPEQHLQLVDGSEDIITNLDNELKELCAEEEEEEAQARERARQEEELRLKGEEQAAVQKSAVDPFEFHEEPEEVEQAKEVKGAEREEGPVVEKIEEGVAAPAGGDAPSEIDAVREEEPEREHLQLKVEVKEEEEEEEEEAEPVLPEIEGEESGAGHAEKFGPDFGEHNFDDVAMEVNKLDKTGRAKRDYSRTKKREDNFDMLLTVDKVVGGKEEETDEMMSDKEYGEDTKDERIQIKSEMMDELDNAWPDEESTIKVKRRISTPATTSDSVPNSPASSSACAEDDRDYKAWKKAVLILHNRICTNKYASLFEKPITNEQAPGYHAIVYRPMDLQTIRRNIDAGVIRTYEEFQRDVLLMFANAVMYNKTDELVYNMARQMYEESVEEMRLFMRAQQQGEGARRETRTSEPGAKRKRGDESFRVTKKRKEEI